MKKQKKMKNRKHIVKGLVLLMAAVLGMLSFTGCGKNTSEVDAQRNEQSSESEKETQTDTNTDTITAEEAISEESSLDEEMQEEAKEEPDQGEQQTEEAEHAGTLVVVFSETGHTKPLAEYAAEYLNADFYEIIPEIPYTDDDLEYNNSSSRTSLEQNDDAARPAITGELPDISGYDTIIIGHPIWWGEAPKIIYTFLESYDWSGKTLVTFCTSASSGLGNSAEHLKPFASGNPEWLESRRFSIGTERDEVIDWLLQIIRVQVKN